MSSINTINATIYQEYFQLATQYQGQYGTKTIILMQVGAFFEIYASDKENHVQMTELAHFCNLNISDKTNGYKMAGFRDYTLDKYLQKITDNEYTAVIFIQEKQGKTIQRVLHSIQSPGTFLSYDIDSSPKMTNHIMCIWCEKKTSIVMKQTMQFICGFSVVNIFTGQSYIYEYNIPYTLNPTTFDELERAICVFAPSEIIIISNMEETIVKTMIQYTGIKTTSIHLLFTMKNNTSVINQQKIKNCQTQSYVEYILGELLGEDIYTICNEFTTFPLATQSFCFLLDFMKEHNPQLVTKITHPECSHSLSHRMILANHTLKQLNIIDGMENNNNNNQYSSVLSLLNQCTSPMGSRLLHHQITNPTTSTIWLQQEYTMTNYVHENMEISMIHSLRKQIGNIRDMDKLCRQIISKKIYPSSIYHLYTSIHDIQQINVCLSEHKEIHMYLCNDITMIDTNAISMTTWFDNHFHLDACRSIHSIHTFEECIIHQGISMNIDNVLQSYQEKITMFDKIQQTLNECIQKKEQKEDIEHVKKHETDKHGYSLVITKTRGKILKSILDALPRDAFLGVVPIKDIRFVSSTNANDEITCPLLTQITKQMIVLKEELNQHIAKIYQVLLLDIEKTWLSSIENLSIFVAKLDVILTKAYIAKKYNYCSPTLVNETETSFVQAMDLRHPLIEHINTKELYVPNDVSLGKNGILLFGTNAVGKTSLIRAVGIAVIMAQCGYYVPCSSFVYKPYTAIFSRILGNDNLFKGLSTFMVEMSELRTILKMADHQSLILGDELASGTENESALSIFASGLIELHAKQASFIFATHMHEIIHVEEINVLPNILFCHLEVYYDREQDCLIYNRKIQHGSGTRMYGLEVCKSLHMPTSFIETAMKIRRRYFPETKGELSHIVSHYHPEKIRGICEICKTNISQETHHMNPQKNADTNGFINTFHKNHPANLLSVCEKCHTQIHTTNIIQQRKKTTKGYILQQSTQTPKQLP